MKKPNKYKNTPTIIDGIRFASKREAKRYQELKLLERAGEISFLELQPKYKLYFQGKWMFTYIADFTYVDERTHKEVTEDAKGIKTQVYRLKKKFIEEAYGIDIVEV